MRSKGGTWTPIRAHVYLAGRRLSRCRYCRTLLVPGHARRHLRCVLKHIALRRAAA